MLRPGDEAPLFLVVHGTGTSPGRARGPLRRNREDLDPTEVAGAVLVAERSSPDDMARIVAAEGTLTLSGAFLSHVSLLSREFGRPSVSLGVRENARLVPPGEPGLLELTDVVGAPGGAVRLEEGDIVVLDGESGLLTVPGGADARARRAVREAHRALLRAAATRDGATAAAVLLPDGPGASAVLAYVLDTLLLPGRPELPGALLLEGLLQDSALRERLAPLLPRVQARAEREALDRLTRSAAALRQAHAVDALDREARAVTALVEREESRAPGTVSEALADARAALREARARRDALIRELEDEVGAGVRLPASVARLQIGRLSMLFRRARAAGADPKLTFALRGKVDALVHAERERCGGRLVVPLRADAPRDRASVGGKAAGLIEAWPHLPPGCRVPAGFVVTVAAYRLHLLGETGERLRRILAEGDGPAGTSRRARAAVLAAPVPPEVAAAVHQARQALGTGPLAVRSSGTHEDGAHASLAGMFDTYLGVRSEPDLLDRLRRCWASQWGERALRAFEAAGVSAPEAGQAVLVQEVVPVVAAGVLLSRDPEGDAGMLLVNAAWGLGESISQGEVPGDLYRLDRRTGAVLSRVHAPQRTRVVLDPAGAGTVDQPLPPELSSRPCLDDAVLGRLAALGRSLEETAGRALDLEFGVQPDATIVLFQARRVARPA
ncbi:MAG TPA: PEP/pyruvate-binding domain-containing protein [Candidatus Polarisedimenticolaceae bacterium]|nr:PEP/pyruvate-binding domain-containing protein [Candidatus Polarisedimenticolaceae bacterium]